MTALQLSKRCLSVAMLCMALMVVALTGCGRMESVAYSKFCSVDTDHWSERTMCVFRPEIADSLLAPGYYKAYLVVRHRDAYPYANLRIRLATESLHGELREECMTITMADNDGSWLGRRFKSLYERKVLLADSLEITPGWQLVITPEMNTPELPGINDIGLILLKYPQQ